MIYMIEPQCKKWQHEEVGAGFLYYMESVSENEELFFFADESHIKAIISIFEKKNHKTRIKFVSIKLPEKITDTYADCKYYKKMFQEIICHNKKLPRKVFYLSAYKSNMVYMIKMAEQFKDISFNICMHGIIEILTDKKNLFQKIRSGVYEFKFLLKRLAYYENIHFITFGPMFNENIKGKLPERIIKKFSFLHVPYIFEGNANHCPQNKHMRIAVIGAAANWECKTIVNKLNQLIPDKEYEFLISDRMNTHFESAHVTLLNEGKVIVRKDIDQILSKSDWMLLAYHRDKYKVSASGIILDAINAEIPIFMLDSPCLKYYSKYNIGIQKDSTADLANSIVEQIDIFNSNNNTNYGDRFKRCKNNLVEENMKVFKQLVFDKGDNCS